MPSSEKDKFAVAMDDTRPWRRAAGWRKVLLPMRHDEHSVVPPAALLLVAEGVAQTGVLSGVFKTIL